MYVLQARGTLAIIAPPTIENIITEADRTTYNGN
jgi:hypothetical protein